MELKLNSGDVITIPDDCKAVIKDNVITVEKEERDFEDGDFCTVKTSHGSWIFIYKSKRNDDTAHHYALLVDGIRIPLYDDYCVSSKDETSVSTEEEKQILIDAMHADGKDWDADKKQIVDYKWKPNYIEVYYHIDYSFDIQIDSLVWYGDALDEICFSNGNCFKTKEEAQKYADKFIELLKERKL